MCFRPSAVRQDKDIQMIRCQNCGQFVSINAAECSNCGEKTPLQNENINVETPARIL